MANAVLEALLSFDKEWLGKIWKPRYEAFNQEWIKSIRHLDIIESDFMETFSEISHKILESATVPTAVTIRFFIQ
jgi:hypothetical protein